MAGIVNVSEPRLSFRLILLCHGATRSMREGAFPSPDEALDTGGIAKIESFVLPGGLSADRTSPASAARQTAALLAQPAVVDDALRDIDLGTWSGLTFAEAQASDPNRFAAWLADPVTGTPGGESLVAVQARMTDWLAERVRAGQSLLAITHPMVMRAALAATLDMPLEATLRIDIAPLCVLRLSWNRTWRLQSIG